MPSRKKTELSGVRFGRLRVELDSGKRGGSREVIWQCRCDCGVVKLIPTTSLTLGRVVSCGCQGRESRIASHTRHGHSKRGALSPEKQTYAAMKARCTNPNNLAYKHYGARGITVCSRWMEGFENFLQDMGLRPSPKHSIDRIDNDGNYGPSNCRWATRQEQMRNTRGTHAVERSDGRRYASIVEAAEDVGVSACGIGAACRGEQQTAGGFGWRYGDVALLRAKAAMAKEAGHG